MTLTTNYSFAPLLTRVLPGAEPAENSDTVGFADGGFATVADFPDGRSWTTFYDAAGNVGLTVSPDAHDSKIAQLTNGDVIVAGTDNSGGIVVYSSGGLLRSITTDSRESNADIAALANGGLSVVVDQADYTASTPGDHDIYIRTVTSSGALSPTIVVDSSEANDQNASVAGLADGGFAVAWERIGAGGSSAAWVAVYNADGSVRNAARQFDGSGSINHQMNVTALESGGFAVGYEENEFGGSDISLAIFNSAGAFTDYAVPSILANDDSEASVTSLSNGLVLTTFTNYIPGEGGQDDYDIRGTLVDPSNGDLLTSQTNPLGIDVSGDADSQSSVSALGLAQFVVSYSSSVSGDVTTKTFQLVRTATGDASDDNFAGDDAVDIVNGLGGDDTLAGGANSDTLNGGSGNDYLNGGTGNDLLDGGANNDFLVGGDGADNLDGGTGADSLLGGLGGDNYVVDNASDEVSETSALATEIDTVKSSVTYTLGANLENLTLTGPSAINGTGNALANTITGNAATNTLNGLAGNDTYFVNNLSDVVIEGTGQGTADIIVASVSYIIGALAQVETLRTTANDGISAINLTGNGFDQTIVGNNGVNVIDGGGSADILQGLGGDDTYFVDNVADVVIEANVTGVDTVNASVTFSLAGQYVEKLNLTGTAAINATGNSLANSITGNSAANTINGGTGADKMTGGLGNDTYIVDNVGDTVIEANVAGVDTVNASVTFSLAGQYVEKLTLTGAAAINATGNSLANTIVGNSGANIIAGGTGLDTLTGNGGNDVFLFNTALGASNVDTITDYNVAADAIQLLRTVFSGFNGFGQATVGRFWSNTTGLAHDADDRIIYETDSGKLFYDADGTGATAGVHFATVDIGLGLTNADFVIV